MWYNNCHEGMYYEKNLVAIFFTVVILAVFALLAYMPENAVATLKTATTQQSKQKPSLVYMTTDISPKGLDAVYKALNRKATGKGKVAVKIHTGEPGGNNFLKPVLIKDFVTSINGTLVECNTAYGGRRATAEMHREAAKEHGFTFAPVDILDATATIKLPVKNGKHLEYDIVGANYKNYDFYVILSHFKGHGMAGFGGAIKNMSVGLASSSGKSYIHSGGKSIENPWGGEQIAFLESMAEAAKSIADDRGIKILYINVMNNLSVDCDCSSNPAKPEMKDIGILASLDPVSLDKACVDLVYKADDSSALKERIESRHGTHVLNYGEEIGLGTRNYKLVKIDK